MNHWTGKKHKPETIEKIRLSLFGNTRKLGKKTPHTAGENSPGWKGDKVGYSALHDWIRNHLPKPVSCEFCKNVPPRDVANISQKYKRDLTDWEWLCRKCHIQKDGRHIRLVESNKISLQKRELQKCNFCHNSFKPTSLRQKYCSRKCKDKFNYYR